MHMFAKTIVRTLASNRFFAGIVFLLIGQAAWIALSSHYPMAFDEDYHLGIIQLYANHPSPFWDSQPAGADAFGAIFREPSYLYQYVFGIIYRLITTFTDSQMAVVLLLRALNIGLFASSLWVFRALLLRIGASRLVTNLCLLIFILLPISPLLAAQINYDNAFIPLTGVAMLLALRVVEGWRAKTAFWLRDLLWLSVVCLVGSLTKYAFLPIILGILIYLIVSGWALWRKSGGLGHSLRQNLLAWRRPLFILAALLTVAFGVLWIERYGINIIRYHRPIPDCAQALSYEHCKSYGPWIRDYRLEHTKTVERHNPIAFMFDWFTGMWLRTFFALDGPPTRFQTRGPLWIPGVAGFVFPAIGLLAGAISIKHIRRHYPKDVTRLFVIVSSVYLAVLWLDGFQSYVKAGRAVAINGRYLLPVMLPVMVLAVFGVQHLLRKRREFQIALASVLIVCLLWGGGALTYILRSNDAWYWPHTPLTVANHAIKAVLGPVSPGYNKPDLFLSFN